MRADLSAALWAETLKARRSLVPWVTAGAIVLAGLVGAFFMFVLQDVDRARSLGLLGTKAQLVGGAADWPGYLALTAQMATVGGLVIFGVGVVWLFGREFSDRTAKDLLALPTSRRAIVLAKLLLALAWCLVLLLLLTGLTLVFGVLLGLPGGDRGAVLDGVGTVLLTGALTAGLVAPYALAASVARGYLAGVGALFGTLIAAQVVSAAGFGAWFPWAVPSLMAGAAGPDATVGAFGVLSVVVVVVVSVAATVLWWERADQSA